MNYGTFLALIDEELDYLQNGGADITGEDDQLKAAGALLVLRDYVVVQRRQLSRIVESEISKP